MCCRTSTYFPKSCFFYFPPTNRCLFGWSVDDSFGALCDQPVHRFRPRQDRRAYMPPTKAPTSAPTRRPLASKPAFLKRFRVGQKLAISAKVSHCSGQLLRAITSSNVLSRQHGFATCAHIFSVLSADFWSPCGRGGFLVISLFRCCADISL